jgi:hypothetical protein
LWSEDWNRRVAGSKHKDRRKFGTFKKGPICLQDHTDRIEFRNIKIRPLPPTAPPVPGDVKQFRSPDARSPFRRTRVIGYSQVGQPRGGWFVADGIFESLVGDERWELMWAGGAGVDKWRDPGYAGWSRPLVSRCPGDTPVDRVLLSISGPYGSDEKSWTEAIDATIENIRDKFPMVRQVILQPVVGGPAGKSCPAPATGAGPDRPDTGRVRASWQHAHIVNAIQAVVKARAKDPVSCIAGFEPTVRTCDDYADALGHLTLWYPLEPTARASGLRKSDPDFNWPRT